ncbi:MAG: hypothetical protein ACTTIZ_00190 [Treponema sp.]
MKNKNILELQREVDNTHNSNWDENNSDIKDNVVLQKSLYDILIEPKFDFNKWMIKFDEYEKRYSRFFYSSISQYILQEKDDKKIAQLIQNITVVTSRVFINDKERNKKLTKSGIPNREVNPDGRLEVSYNKYLMIFKLYDHCHLANKQRMAYKATKEDIERRIGKIANSKIRKYEKSITSQLIGLVAIFTALSFVVFGGINTSTTIFKMVEKISIAKILVLLDVWFICMSNLFILFMKMIATITRRHFKTRWYFLIVNIILIIILGVLLYAIIRASSL